MQSAVGSAAWRTLDFISDLHLQAANPATFAAWQRYMANCDADALFILGDLFEVWVGDDVLAQQHQTDHPFENLCINILQKTSQRLPVFLLHGNRDFLLGEQFARVSGVRLLADPCLLMFDRQRLLLSHGDALCLADVDYQQFRQRVRSNNWRSDFLALPLSERHRIARQLRRDSASRKTSGAAYADVDSGMALQWLTTAQASTLIHGHTHHPGDMTLGLTPDTQCQRSVLSDWDADTQPPRLEVLRLRAGQKPERIQQATLGSGFQ